MLAEGRTGSGAFAFCFATFAISWPRIGQRMLHGIIDAGLPGPCA